MQTSAFSAETRRWFFIGLAAVVVYLSWRIVEPLALTLLLAAIAAVVLAPFDGWMRLRLRRGKLASALTVVIAFVVIFIPLVVSAVVVVQQSSQIVSSGLAPDGWIRTLDLRNNRFVDMLPAPLREEVSGIDLSQAGRSAAGWVFEHVGGVVSTTAGFLFKSVFFFIFLYYFLSDRKRLREEMIALSPFRDTVDKDIITRMVSAIRNIVFGALVIALIKGALAAFGMAVTGVPGWALWGAFAVIASQIPMVGVALVLLPAILYLFFTGHPVAGTVLGVWSVFVVGLVDNVLSPLLLQGRTKMHAFLILIFLLGGINFFGTIGFIVGPTVLAALLVVLELYKKGALERA